MNSFYEQHDRLMTYAQTITGFFDHVAESQQAVQRLLAQGFTIDHILFSAPPGAETQRERTDPGTSGRFLVSLLGLDKADLTADESVETDKPMWQRTAIRVSVQIQSAHEVDLAVEAFCAANSVHFGTYL
ncbi:hypothetical protein ACAW74_24755 [Fibrella sp. WM1]|uniref:hypothetical protein n=1 Tax=Fibrella musci TaxID=3242485 RepID=UPI00352202A4